MSNYNIYIYFVLTFNYVMHIRPYNLFSTCKNVLCLKLYFKPNDAIWKRHLFYSKPYDPILFLTSNSGLITNLDGVKKTLYFFRSYIHSHITYTAL